MEFLKANCNSQSHPQQRKEVRFSKAQKKNIKDEREKERNTHSSSAIKCMTAGILCLTTGSYKQFNITLNISQLGYLRFSSCRLTWQYFDTRVNVYVNVNVNPRCTVYTEKVISV